MFAEIVARLVAREVPHCVTSERTVAKRPPGKIYIDVSQNAYGRPLATAYVVRPFPQAPISTPVKRAELRRTLRPERFNLKTIFERLREKGDLWSEFSESCQRIEKALRALSVELPAPRKR
jgi:bifunctional non-homologous end joining protein LigD